MNGEIINKKEKAFIIIIIGNRYEGEWKNDDTHGKGIYYYSNGSREMGDYADGIEIGKHVILTSSGEVKEKFY